MKLLILACVLCSVFSKGFGVTWDIAEDNKKCLIVDWNVTQMLLSGPDGQQQSIDPTAGKVDNNSACTDNLSTLNVDIGNSVLSLTFSKNSDGMVYMDSTFTFKPSDYFTNSSLDMAVVDLNDEVELSNDNSSYLCNSDVEYKFTGNLTYDLTLKVNSVQIQAFNLADDGSFSDASVCAQDEAVSTEGPGNSTEPATTEGPGNSTEPATTAPPAQPTTAPAPSAGKFYYPNKTDACVIVEGDFTFAVTYTKTDDSKMTIPITIPAEVNVEGSCPAGGISELSVSWEESGAKRKLIFSFSDNQDVATLSKMDVEIDLDNATFPGAKDNSTTEEKVVNIPLFKTDGYMSCKAAQSSELGDVTVNYKNVKIQAFNVKDGDFTGEAQPCEADQEPPTAGSPPTNKYTVGDTNCIVFDGGIEFVIPYKRKDGEDKPATVGIPDNTKSTVTVSGTCGTTDQTLTLEFYNDWSVSMIFGGGQPENGLLAASTDFYLQNVSITYSLDDEKLFPEANETGSRTVESSISGTDTFNGALGQSYKCNKEQTVDLDNDLKMNTYNLQYAAYSSKNSTEFGDSPTECPSDSSTNSIVPIAVGAALAALVIIVLVAYLIGRRRSRTGYEQV